MPNSSTTSYTIFVAIIFIIFHGRTGETRSDSQEQVCSECTTKIEDAITTYKDLLKEDTAIEATLPPPIGNCLFYGSRDIDLVGEVCPTKIEGTDNCYNHKIQFIMRNLTGKCNTELPFNPAELLKVVQKKADPGIMCKSTNEPAIDPALQAEGVKALPEINPANYAKLLECKPMIPKLGKQTKKTVSGGIAFSIAGMKIIINIESCGDQAAIKKVELPDPRGYTGSEECLTSEDESFMAPCNCLMKSRVLQNIFVAAGLGLVPCTAASVYSGTSLEESLTCNDIINQ